MKNKFFTYERARYLSLLGVCVLAVVSLVITLFCSKESSPYSWKRVTSTLFGINYHSDKDYVAFLDVGQGDSILISSNGYHALVDFGNGLDYGSGLIETLDGYGVDELDCIIATHYDSDHIGGGTAVFNSFKVLNAVIPELGNDDSDAALEFRNALSKSQAAVQIAIPGTVINVGEIQLTVIGYYRDMEEDNDRSLVIMAEIDGIKFLLTGDVGEATEERLFLDGVMLDCDVLKAAHHGSRDGTTTELIQSTSPAYAVISVGASNAYGHPHDEVISRLYSAGVKVLRTDISGDIIFVVENKTLKVDTER
ncbi:MAG: MBL fold metallo-hydrolase [Clostridia bacterium]|nr:MBL fold metallo-hydrolase [Clostridia bacterium]